MIAKEKHTLVLLFHFTGLGFFVPVVHFDSVEFFFLKVHFSGKGSL